MTVVVQASRRIIFVTHAEVVIDPAVPVPDWGLSALGQARHAAFASDPVLSGVTALYCSDERKARDAAERHGKALGLVPVVVSALGENDRSATGYLPKAAFEQMADAFFAQPDAQVSGWESARSAQSRIVAALHTIAELDDSYGDILIVSHGAVGTLARCACLARPIARSEDQPGNGGGNYFVIELPGWTTHPEWRSF